MLSKLLRKDSPALIIGTEQVITKRCGPATMYRSPHTHLTQREEARRTGDGNLARLALVFDLHRAGTRSCAHARAAVLVVFPILTGSRYPPPPVLGHPRASGEGKKRRPEKTRKGRGVSGPHKVITAYRCDGNTGQFTACLAGKRNTSPRGRPLDRGSAHGRRQPQSSDEHSWSVAPLGYL